MNAIEISALARRFGDATVLRDVELTVATGEQVTISGPNGSGKTTLLRIVCGLMRPSDGRVSVLDGSPSHPDVRRRIGVIGHIPALYPRMTASENLRFWGRIYDAPDASQRGEELLHTLGLDANDTRPVGTYSQGMRQKVNIARALSTAPDLIVADEPLAALDENSAHAVVRLLTNGRALITATHDTTPFTSARHLRIANGSLQ